MKNFTKLFGIIVFLAIIVFSMVGCELPKEPEFPSEFRGTWERDFQTSYTNTLTFTSDTLKASNQSFQWILVDVSGDDYTIEQSNNRNHSAAITIRFINGKLEISENYQGADQDNWNGTWRKR